MKERRVLEVLLSFIVVLSWTIFGKAFHALNATFGCGVCTASETRCNCCRFYRAQSSVGYLFLLMMVIVMLFLPRAVSCCRGGGGDIWHRGIQASSSHHIRRAEEWTMTKRIGRGGRRGRRGELRRLGGEEDQQTDLRRQVWFY